MVAGEGPYDCLYIMCSRMMRCLALDAVMLMWVLNESDESNVTPRNFALLYWYVCVVDCDVFDVFLGGVAFTWKKYLCRFAGI